MVIKQLSVFVENKHGRLAEILDIIAKADCSILALTIADTTDFGILRVIVQDTDKAKKALRENGLAVSMSDVISVKIPDKAGALSNALVLLSQNDISVEYMYAFISKADDEAQVVLKVNSPAKATEVLNNAGFGY